MLCTLCMLPWRSGALVGLLLTAGYVVAQQPAPPQPAQPQPAGQRQPTLPQAQPQQGAQPQPGQPAANPSRVTANRPVDGAVARTPDQEIAQCLAIGNQEEIALARLAQQKASSKEVKDFAEQLMQDHTKALDSLKQFGAQKVQLGASGALEQANQQRPARAAQAGGATGGRQFDFVEVKERIAEQCLADSQKEWSEKKAEDAEMCYVGSQLVAHKQMIAAQKVLRDYASPQLQATIDQSLSATQAHLKHAEKLLDSLIAKSHQQQPQR